MEKFHIRVHLAKVWAKGMGYTNREALYYYVEACYH